MHAELINDALRVRLQQARVGRLLDEMVAAEALAIPGSAILTSDPDDLRALLADQRSTEVHAI